MFDILTSGTRKSTWGRLHQRKACSLCQEVVNFSAQPQVRRILPMDRQHPANPIDPPLSLSTAQIRPHLIVSTRTGPDRIGLETAPPAQMEHTGQHQIQPLRTGSTACLPRSYSTCTYNSWLWYSAWCNNSSSSSMKITWTWCRIPFWWQPTCSRRTCYSRWQTGIQTCFHTNQPRWNPWYLPTPNWWRIMGKTHSSGRTRIRHSLQEVMIKGRNYEQCLNNDHVKGTELCRFITRESMLDKYIVDLTFLLILKMKVIWKWLGIFCVQSNKKIGLCRNCITV